MKVALLLAWLACALAVTRAALADERRVVVIIPQRLPEAPWPEATQAVIAELAAGDYQVLVDSSRSTSVEELHRELAAAIENRDTAGAVAVVRRGSSGVAYVRTRRDSAVMTLEADETAGAVAEGRLALRVAELLRTRDLELPAPEPRPEPRAQAPLGPAAPRPAPPRPARETRRQKTLVWIGPGFVFTSDAPRPITSLDLGAQIPLFGGLAAEAGVAVSLAALELDTAPGRVTLSTRQAAGRLVLEPWSAPRASVAVGLGGGAVWLEQSAEARGPGLDARSNSTTVALLSASLRGTLYTDRVMFVLAVEPGTLLPAVSVESPGTELASLGQPWIVIATGIGLTL